MTVWIIEPHDPLIVRDGRPFGPDPGARATSLSFPFPSTIAGGIRSRAGMDEDGVFRYTPDDKEALENLKQLSIRGPLLVQLTKDGGSILPKGWLVPAPRDALLLPVESNSKDKSIASVLQLVPLEVLEDAWLATLSPSSHARSEGKVSPAQPDDVWTDTALEALFLVGLQLGQNQQKPLKKVPHYWYWETFLIWLLDPSKLTKDEKPLSELGLPGLVREQRLHVSMDAEKEIAKDGMLFETSGLVFTASDPTEHGWDATHRLALAVVAEDNEYTIRSGLASFGGERRIVAWRKSDAELPLCPAEIEQAIVDSKACRIFLLTPACFKQGYYPEWVGVEAEKNGLSLKFKAIAIQRPQVVSGWDLALNSPKPSRRLASSGTVFFISLESSDESAIRDWVRSIWMHCISDDQQDRTDGFGLAVLGTWSGILLPLEKEDNL